jgi:hypothetical protein
MVGLGTGVAATASSCFTLAAAFFAFSRSTTSDTALTTDASMTVSLVTSVISKADNRLPINLLDTLSCFARSLTVILSIEPPPNFGKKMNPFECRFDPPLPKYRYFAAMFFVFF